MLTIKAQVEKTPDGKYTVTMFGVTTGEYDTESEAQEFADELFEIEIEYNPKPRPKALDSGGE